MRVTFVSFHMPQHARHSGYSQLLRWINGKKIDSKDSQILLRFIPVRFKKRLVAHSGLAWFNLDRLATECYVILNMLIKQRRIFHFIYGENSYRYSAWFAKIRGHKIICTYHLPPSVFPDIVGYTEQIRKLDAIVAVAHNQIDFFTQFIPREKIFFIPHGVDTAFFRPPLPSSKRKDNICLFVGHWLRDFKILKEVIRIVHSKNSSVQFVVITPQKDFKYFQEEKEAILKARLDEEELLHYYQTATLFLQPMEGCTANNSVLESLACGLPMVVTDVGGIRDYVDESCAVLIPPNNPEKMVEELLKLLEDKPRLQQMSEDSRKKALEFSWPKIAEKMKRVYEEVIEK